MDSTIFYDGIVAILASFPCSPGITLNGFCLCGYFKSVLYATAVRNLVSWKDNIKRAVINNQSVRLPVAVDNIIHGMRIHVHKERSENWNSYHIVQGTLILINKRLFFINLILFVIHFCVRFIARIWILHNLFSVCSFVIIGTFPVPTLPKFLIWVLTDTF